MLMQNYGNIIATCNYPIYNDGWIIISGSNDRYGEKGDNEIPLVSFTYSLKSFVLIKDKY